MLRTLPSRTVPRTTFSVASVTLAAIPLRQEEYADALSAAIPNSQGAESLEAYSRDTKPLVASGQVPHAFVYAVNQAYDLHYPLVLSPDMIWLLIAQGFAQHVNANAETLRDRVVAHSGQIMLAVVRNEFIRGFSGNDWEGVFSEFSEKTREHIGAANHQLLVPHFSTTGIVERAAFEVTLLDSMQSYFNYVLFTRCGIPNITLEGTTEDWVAIRNSAADLSRFDLAWWTDHLIPVLDQFVSASQGEADRSFWEEFYKLDDGSGGPYINGHIVNFFPYLVPRRADQKRREAMITNLQRMHVGLSRAEAEQMFEETQIPYRSPYLGRQYDAGDSNHAGHDGITSRVLPPALSCAPFTWDYRGTIYPMEFLAGFIGVAQDSETLALRPEIGWAVRDQLEQ